MDHSITSTLIVAGFALIGTIISAKYVSNVRVVKLEMQMAQLEHKVTKHNNLVERMYIVERDICLLKEGKHILGDQ